LPFSGRRCVCCGRKRRLGTREFARLPAGFRTWQAARVALSSWLCDATSQNRGPAERFICGQCNAPKAPFVVPSSPGGTSCRRDLYFTRYPVTTSRCCANRTRAQSLRYLAQNSRKQTPKHNRPERFMTGTQWVGIFLQHRRTGPSPGAADEANLTIKCIKQECGQPACGIDPREA